MSADIPIFISIPTDASPRLVLTITRTLGLAFGILCSFVFVYVCFHLGVNWYQRRHNPEAWAQSKAEQERASEKISCNFFRLGKCFFRLSFSVEEHKRSRGRKSLPFLFALVFIISIIVINSAISQKNPSTNTYVIQMSLLQVGFVLWFLGFNGFLINRIMSYHKQRTEERKRLAKLRRLTCNPGYADAGIPKPDLPPKDQPYLLPSMCTGPSASGLSNSSDVNLTLSAQSPPADSDTDGYSVSSSLDDPHSTLSSTRSGPPTDTHKFKRRIKHIQPQHWKINLTLWNSIQITNIFIEFFQLVSYPLRDLLRNDAFQEYITNLQLNDTYSDDGVIALLNSLRLFFSTLSSGVPSLDYALLMRVQFVVAWWTMLFAWVLVVVSRLLLWALARGQEPTQLAGWRLGCRKFLTGTWILYFIPLVNLFYMILLNAFIEPLGCLISNTVPPWPPRTDANHSQMVQNRLDAIQSRIAYCAPIHDNSPPLNTWFAMSGYLMCYTLLTMFRISNEPDPKAGVVSFTPRSEVLNKNGCLTILLLYTLLSTQDFSTTRGVLAALVLAAMIAHNIIIGSSYSIIANHIKSGCYILCWWMSLVVVYYTHPANADLLTDVGTGALVTVIAGGAMLIAIYFAILWWLNRLHFP